MLVSGSSVLVDVEQGVDQGELEEAVDVAGRVARKEAWRGTVTS
jgi:hypothetical protein